MEYRGIEKKLIALYTCLRIDVLFCIDKKRNNNKPSEERMNADVYNNLHSQQNATYSLLTFIFNVMLNLDILEV